MVEFVNQGNKYRKGNLKSEKKTYRLRSKANDQTKRSNNKTPDYNRNSANKSIRNKTQNNVNGFLVIFNAIFFYTYIRSISIIVYFFYVK